MVKLTVTVQSAQTGIGGVVHVARATGQSTASAAPGINVVAGGRCQAETGSAVARSSPFAVLAEVATGRQRWA